MMSGAKLLFLLASSASAFAPPGLAVHSIRSPASVHALRTAEAHMFGGGPTGSATGPLLEQRVIVPRGGLVWPHVHAANLLISACLEFFHHLGGGRSPVADIPRPKPQVREGRSSEPVFLEGALCEHFTDETIGHDFWVCQNKPSAEEDYVCRCTIKNGRRVYYCNERTW